MRYQSQLLAVLFLTFSMYYIYTYTAYVVNHSRSYTIATLSCWLEFWLESLLLGGSYKSRMILGDGLFSMHHIGVFMVVMGQTVRSLAMWQCGENFSHIIADEKKRNHKLVTTGIYRYLRHPSYFGWYYWSIGTQLLLCNPICSVAFACTAWFFFQERISYEEALLQRFFKHEYTEYVQRSYIGIPFITSALSEKTPLEDDGTHPDGLNESSSSNYTTSRLNSISTNAANNYTTENDNVDHDR